MIALKFLAAVLLMMNCIIIAAVIANRVKDLSDKMVTALTIVVFVQVCTGVILSILTLSV